MEAIYRKDVLDRIYDTEYARTAIDTQPHWRYCKDANKGLFC